MKRIKVQTITNLDDRPLKITEGEETVDLTIVRALNVLVDLYLGQMKAASVTMNDSLHAMRMKDALRQWKKENADKEEPTPLLLDDEDMTYWTELMETAAPSVFGINAIKVKMAFTPTE